MQISLNSPSLYSPASGEKEKLPARNYENFRRVYRPQLRLSFERSTQETRETRGTWKFICIVAADPHQKPVQKSIDKVTSVTCRHTVSWVFTFFASLNCLSRRFRPGSELGQDTRRLASNWEVMWRGEDTTLTLLGMIQIRQILFQV